MEFRLGKINVLSKTNQKRVKESLSIFANTFGVSKDQDIIQVNNSMQTLVTAKEQHGFSEQCDNPKDHSQPKGKPFHW